MKLSVTVATIAAAVEFSVLHAAAVALVSGQNPSCTSFDLSRWGLLDLAADLKAISDKPAERETRERSRSPHRSESSKPKGSAGKESKGSGKPGTSHHGRSGLEPSVIKLLRALYAKDWSTVGSICDSIYWSRKNIRDQVW